MNIEVDFIKALFKQKDFTIVTDKKINADSLNDITCKEAFTYIFKFWSDYGKFPKKKTFYKKYNIFRKIKAQEPLTYYCDEVRKKVKYNKLSSYLNIIAEKMDKNVDEACEDINKLIMELTDFNVSKAIRLVRDRLRALKEYKELKKKGGLTGYRSGFDWLDKELGGFNREELITVVARPKTGKTWFLCMIAAEMFKLGYNILFISMEMEPRFIRKRINAYLFKLPYRRFRKGLLTEDEYKKFKKGIKLLDDLPNELVIINDVFDIGSLVSRCKQHSPTVVFVDGIYLLNASKGVKDWERVSEISRGLKQAAQILNVPVIASTQLNRGAVGSKLPELHHISFTDSIGQDSTVVMALYANQEMKENKKMLIRLLGSRESPVIARGMHWDLDKMNFIPLNKEETKGLFFDIGKKSSKKEDDDGSEFFT